MALNSSKKLFGGLGDRRWKNLCILSMCDRLYRGFEKIPNYIVI